MSPGDRPSIFSCLLAGLAIVFAGAGCSTAPAPAAAAKPASKPLYSPPPDRVQTSTLLDFENTLDSTFVDAPSVRFAGDPAHPGNRVLVADGGVQANLTSLVRGRDVGGAWDVLGVRVWSDQRTACNVQLAGIASSTAKTELAPNAWTQVWLTLPPKAAASASTASATGEAPDDSLKLIVSPAAAKAHLLLDDVALAKSHVTVSESPVPKTNERWKVARVGLKWVASVDGHAIFELPAAPFVPTGYRLLQSDPTRALFINGSGSTICIDRTGRLIEDGRAKLDPVVLKFARAIAENASPALIEIVGTEGRVERSLPGDRDNDGYDETRGCYAVRAVAGRVAVRLTRQHATVKWPALEVYDLPPGEVSVWLDGEIIPWAVRADDGRIIVELPIELERPVEVQIRMK